MSYIVFHGTQESLDHIADRLKHHRSRRDPMIKIRPLAPQALIVDDDVESIQPLQVVLRNFGFETTLAFDGREAFAEISKRPFDIVFLDICMPEMTGLEVLRQVEEIRNLDRRMNHRAHPLPVVTYSSYSQGEFEIPEGKSFFLAGHWQKPVTMAELATMTSRTLEDLKIRINKAG